MSFTVHAKERDDVVIRRRGGLNLKEMPVKVQRVIVDGLGRTKDDIIVKQVEGVFAAENFVEMAQLGMVGKEKLGKLGIFKNVNLIIDTSKAPNATQDAYDIIYNVEESRFMTGGAHTQTGTNSANLLFNVRIPNLFGRAEKFITQYTYGMKQCRGLELHFMKLVNNNTDVVVGLTGSQLQAEYPWSGYKETDRGVGVDISFPSLIGDHNLKWEGVWRELRCLSGTTSFAVREQAGHSLKSSIKHTFVRDGRDDPILPKEGCLFRIIQEYAGIGGNARFFKNDIEFQANKSLFLHSVFQMSLAAGMMKSLDPNTPILINDRFFLGGPLTLRGFNMKGVGPHSDGNALGGDTYCLGALHLYTPLPFSPGKGGLGEIFRSHFFVNAGNCGNVQDFNLGLLNRSNMDLFRNTLRLSYGAGIVLRLGGIARIELNYVVPLWQQQGDSSNAGLQLGVGITFL